MVKSQSAKMFHALPRNWSEFSLRARPQPIKKYQAGSYNGNHREPNRKDIMKKTGQNAKSLPFRKPHKFKKHLKEIPNEELLQRKSTKNGKSNAKLGVCKEWTQFPQNQRVTRRMWSDITNLRTRNDPDLVLQRRQKKDGNKVPNNCKKDRNQNASSCEAFTMKTPDAYRRKGSKIERKTDFKTTCDDIKNDLVTGTVIWGKILKSRWWPGIIFEGPLAGMNSSREGQQWIFWLGDHRITQMKCGNIEIFSKNYHDRCSGKLSGLLQRAISEAIQICSSRVTHMDTEMLKTGEFRERTEKFLTSVLFNKGQPDPSLPREDEELPDWILYKLNYLKENRIPSQSLSQGKKCFSCRGIYSMVCQHPLFEAEICGECKESLQESLFAMDVDGTDVFCCICSFGDGSVLLVCSSESCKRSYCSGCLNNYLTEELFEKVECKTRWICFLCSPYKKETHGLLKPNHSHKASILNFFNSFELPVHETYSASSDKLSQGKLRVLSICDGIGTLKSVLDDLDLEIDSYNSSEIDNNALLVSSTNHGPSITQIGDMSQLESLWPLDLIVFSPPDPSIVDEGNLDMNLDITDERVMLLLKCVTVLKDVDLIAGNQPYFWLLETTPALPHTVTTAVSNILGIEPCLWSCEFLNDCPYTKPRLYWTNIPGVYIGAKNQVNEKRNKSVMKLDWTELGLSQGKSDLECSKSEDCSATIMAESTESHCFNRKKITRVRTGNIESSKQSGNNEDTHQLGEISEKRDTDVQHLLDKIERSMGYPLGYTGTANLSPQQRATLLKEASCPKLLKHLLGPLTQYFKCKTYDCNP